MVKSIWKFELKIDSIQELSIPANAKILDVQNQDGTPCIWVLVKPGTENETRKFEIFGTGQPIEEDEHTNRNYIGTFQTGSFVWHLFEFDPK